MIFFKFPKVNWLQLTGEVGKSMRVHVKFSQDFIYEKSLKSVHFKQSY